MNESILKSILEESVTLEWDKCNNAPNPKLSLKHRLAMKRIFKLYEKNTRAAISIPEPKPIKLRLTRRTLLRVLVIVFLAILAGCTAAYFISQDFHGEIHKEYIKLLPTNTDNCPNTIVQKYYLSALPSDFSLLQTYSTEWDVYTSYEYSSPTEAIGTITLRQFIKTDSCPIYYYKFEKCELREVDINEHCGLLIDYSGWGTSFSSILWDNGDYILELCGTLDKNALIDLAKTAKVESF